MRKIVKKITAGILAAISLFSITSCGLITEKLEGEKQALQQQIEALEKENSSIQADKENLQNQMDGINNALPGNQQLIEKYQEIVDRQELYGIPLHVNAYEGLIFYGGPSLAQFLVVSDRNIFDIDDVRLKIYYGSDYSIEQLSEKSCDYYEIAFYEVSHGSIKFESTVRVEGNYYTQENLVELTLNESGSKVKEIKYKNFVELSIPAKVFNKEYAYLTVALRTFKKEGDKAVDVEKYEFPYILEYYKSADGSKVIIWNAVTISS